MFAGPDLADCSFDAVSSFLVKIDLNTLDSIPFNPRVSYVVLVQEP